MQCSERGVLCRRWATGILLFEMLAGFPPFYDENPFLIYQRVLSGRLDFPFHVDPQAKARPVIFLGFRPC